MSPSHAGLLKVPNTRLPQRLMCKPPELRTPQASLASVGFTAQHGYGACTSESNAPRNCSSILIGPPTVLHSVPTWHLDNSATSAPDISRPRLLQTDILSSLRFSSSHTTDIQPASDSLRWEGQRHGDKLACLDRHGTEPKEAAAMI